MCELVNIIMDEIMMIRIIITRIKRIWAFSFN
jgi:hypothetical protein